MARDSLSEPGRECRKEASWAGCRMQVRTEERVAANDLLHATVDQAKRELGERTEVRGCRPVFSSAGFQ
jgi:hypothetical protein